MNMQQGKTYYIQTAARPVGFSFKCLSAGAGGAVGYMDESASWPRSVSFAEITFIRDRDADKLGCGCCPGPEADRCCCHIHQDIPMGLRAKVCSHHRTLSGERAAPAGPRDGLHS